MAVSNSERSSVTRCDDLSTLGEVARTFFSYKAPRFLMVLIVAVAIGRLLLGSVGWVDLVIVILTLVMVGPMEWVIHRYLLHAPDGSFRKTTLETGTGHVAHHRDPHDVGWTLLSLADAGGFLVILSVWAVVWTVPFALLVGATVIAAVVTSFLLSVIGLFHYEWTHLLIHTRYRPKTRYYKRLANNHRLHHYRNETYWLGVTSNLGDRVLSTLPSDKGDVPLSQTARNLGG